MAKYQTPPKNLKEADEITIKDFIVATEQKFKGDLFGEVNSNFNESYTTPDGRFHWDSVRDLFDYITTLTETDDVRSANAVLYQTLTPTPKFEEPTMTDTTALRADELAELQRRKEEVDVETEKSKLEAQRKVQEFLDQKKKRAEQLHNALKDKKLYARIIEGKDVANLTPEETNAIEALQKAVEKNPKEVFQQIYEEIKATAPKDVPDEAIQLAAYDAVESLNNNPDASPVTQASYYSGFVSSPVVIRSITKTDEKEAKEIIDSVVELSNSRISQLELSKRLFARAYGARASQAVFKEQTVEFSEVKTADFSQEVDLSQIAKSYSTDVSNQQVFFESIKDLGYDQLDSRLRAHLGGIIERKIATLPAGHVLKGDAVKTILGVYKLGPAVEWVAVEGASPMIRFAVSSGYGPLLGTIQSATGWKLGVSKLVGEAAKKVGEKVAGSAAVGAVAKAGTGIIAKILTAISGVTGPVGLAISAAITYIGSKLAKLIPWHKIKEFINNARIFLLGGGLTALAILPVPFNLIVGVPSTILGIGGVASSGISGASIGNAVSGIGRVASFVMTTALAGIGTPILVTLLVFPIIVALILFIINSGAYIVPPTAPDSAFTGTGASVVCSDEKGSVGFGRVSGVSPIAQRAYNITADLYQGFWCFWNRSPKAPEKYFPNDVLNYPDGYPELFDYELFLKNPNPNRSDAPNLFWCTWLPIKAYADANNPITANVYSPTMYEDFKNRKKIIDASQASVNNVETGAVVFFDVNNELNRIDHVGVVYSKTTDGVRYVQSNAPTKDGFIPFGTNGLQDIPGIDVVAIGNP